MFFQFSNGEIMFGKSMETIRQLHEQIETLKSENSRLLSENDRLQKRVDISEAQVAELEALDTMAARSGHGRRA
jgi:regulator of replication initiation timing